MLRTVSDSNGTRICASWLITEPVQRDEAEKKKEQIEVEGSR